MTLKALAVIHRDMKHEIIGTRWTRSRCTTPDKVQSTYWALQEDASFAAHGDTDRNYGFVTVRSVNLTCETAMALSFNRMLISRHASVQDHCVACGWKPLRIKAPLGSFDSTTRAAYVILQGAFFRMVCCYLTLLKQ